MILFLDIMCDNVDQKGVFKEIDNDFSMITNSIKDTKKCLTGMNKALRLLERNINKNIKKLKKKSNKNKVKKTKKKSGFSLPVNISDELCDFLKVESGTKMARTEVTKQIHKYIKDHDLQNKNDRRKLVPNKQFKKLLNLNNKDTNNIGYFNLQRYMNRHYIKNTKETH
jgi:upstream activation factor subunit UAF30|tara:strand:+ start:2979 stop:3485 length:507 start_codon:yes stop_codon:yes gene_type:complete